MNESSPPDPQVWAAPATWRAIDFISDLHLAPGLPQTVAAWSRYLSDTTADAVCMLGDVFEVWVGDDSRDQAFERGLVDAMAVASARRPLYFMVGNRDFLVGPALCAEAGLTALRDPTVLQAWGGRWALCHGDAQCLDDARYQAFRSDVRSARWQQGFLARPLPERVELAREMRRQSMQRQSSPQESIGDLDADACRELLSQADAPTLVHGHTHRPGAHDLGGGRSRVVLSDWDLDDDRTPRAEVMRLSSDGRLQRLSPLQACTR